MTEPDLNFIAEQLKRVLTEMTAMRADMTAIRTDLLNLADGQTVLTGMVLQLQRDMVRVKDLLGKMDGRISRLEQAVP